MKKLFDNIPEGPLAEKWTKYKSDANLVNPSNRRNIDIIVVGTGLAGSAAAASLGEMGFNVNHSVFKTLLDVLTLLLLRAE